MTHWPQTMSKLPHLHLIFLNALIRAVMLLITTTPQKKVRNCAEVLQRQIC